MVGCVEKSLSCLTGDARSLLVELDHDRACDYNTLVGKLLNRFGSVNWSEVNRTQLKYRVKKRRIKSQHNLQKKKKKKKKKKMMRQAYPDGNKDIV